MARKKEYSLDYDIYYAKDRAAAVDKILDDLNTIPNNTDLEYMADYILYGKDEKYISAVDEKIILNPQRRYSNYKTKSEKGESLDAILEDPIAGPEAERVASDNTISTKYKVPRLVIKRTKYHRDGTIAERGDDFDTAGNEIPFMRELWERIDHYTYLHDQYTGKVPQSEWVKAHPKTQYQIWKMGHMLIDMRRSQYYIKDAYNPELHFFNVGAPEAVPYDFDNDTGYWLTPEEWCYRKRHPRPYDAPQPAFADAPQNEQGLVYWCVSRNRIDYEDPKHIIALIQNYVALLRRSYEKPFSTTRTLCYDLERYVEAADLTDKEDIILCLTIARKNRFVICHVLEQEGFEMTDYQVARMQRTIIPKKIALAAKRMRLETEMRAGTVKGKLCSKCKKLLPATLEFFCRSSDKSDGFCCQCKDCQRKKRERDR